MRLNLFYFIVLKLHGLTTKTVTKPRGLSNFAYLM